jgi:hypothetical protein
MAVSLKVVTYFCFSFHFTHGTSVDNAHVALRCTGILILCLKVGSRAFNVSFSPIVTLRTEGTILSFQLVFIMSCHLFWLLFPFYSCDLFWKLPFCCQVYRDSKIIQENGIQKVPHCFQSYSNHKDWWSGNISDVLHQIVFSFCQFLSFFLSLSLSLSLFFSV